MSSIYDSTSQDTDMPLMWIELKQLEIQCIVGIYDVERYTPQTLVIDLALALQPRDWLKAASQGDLESSLDYAQIAQRVSTLVQYAQCRLLESLYYVIMHFFLNSSLQHSASVTIEAVRLHIKKPQAISPQGTPTPSISGRVNRAQWRRILPTLSIPPKRSHDSKNSLEFMCDSYVPIIDLPELYIAKVYFEDKGHRTFQLQEDVGLVPLSGQCETQHHQVSWSGSLLAFYIQRKNFKPMMTT